MFLRGNTGGFLFTSSAAQVSAGVLCCKSLWGFTIFLVYHIVKGNGKRHSSSTSRCLPRCWQLQSNIWRTPCAVWILLEQRWASRAQIGRSVSFDGSCSLRARNKTPGRTTSELVLHQSCFLKKGSHFVSWGWCKDSANINLPQGKTQSLNISRRLISLFRSHLTTTRQLRSKIFAVAI